MEREAKKQYRHQSNAELSEKHLGRTSLAQRPEDCGAKSDSAAEEIIFFLVETINPIYVEKVYKKTALIATVSQMSGLRQVSAGLFSLSAAILFVPLHILAQPNVEGREIIHSDYGRNSQKLLIGLVEAEVLRTYGEPDSKKQTGPDAGEWRYGASVVYLESGKVTASLDSGELAKRENIQAVKVPKKRASDPFHSEWVNPWTPKKNNEALDELMKDE